MTPLTHDKDEGEISTLLTRISQIRYTGPSVSIIYDVDLSLNLDSERVRKRE